MYCSYIDESLNISHFDSVRYLSHSLTVMAMTVETVETVETAEAAETVETVETVDC